MKAITALCVLLILVAHCLAYDDGKYHPKKYSVIDDGKYYRPLDEGKYIPGDEGRYTYVYKQGLYPDFPYVHQVGPNGGYGGYGYGEKGGNGPNEANGSGGSSGPNVNGPDRPAQIQYIGHKIYAERFPYIHKVIEALIDKYVSLDSIFGEASEGSSNHYMKVFADKETAVKCQYLKPNNVEEEFTTQYPPRPENGKKSGSYYSFKGTKILNNVTSANLNSVLKLEYEVFVRIVDEVGN